MTAESAIALSEIRAFRWLAPRWGTSGQPTARQFEIIRSSGFETVVNLALPTSDFALENEAEVVTALAMRYVHIPVPFDLPTHEHFRKFDEVLRASEDRPVYVHCALNMRVSAFMYVYRRRAGLVSDDEAANDLKAIWEPDNIWSRFIEQELHH